MESEQEKQKPGFYAVSVAGLRRAAGAVAGLLRRTYRGTKTVLSGLGEGGYKKLPRNLLRFFKTRAGKITAGVIALLLLAVLMTDYLTTLRIVELSGTANLDARGGKIVIRYSRPVSAPGFIPDGDKLYVRTSLSKDGLTETHVLSYPTAYASRYKLVLAAHKNAYKLFGLFRLPDAIHLTTGIEKISVKDLDPTGKSVPEPQLLGNRIVIVFNGEFNRRYAQNKKLLPDEVGYVSMTPKVKGYFRWSKRNELSFYFTDTGPQFDTKYSFTVYPQKLIDAKTQAWVGEKTRFSLRTSKYDIRIRRFSLQGKVDHRQPLLIHFSGDMVPVTKVNKTLELEQLASISPAVNGKWTWISTTTLKFVPEKEWPIRSTVTVAVKKSINRVSNRPWRFGKPRRFSFYVRPIVQRISSFNISGEQVELDQALKVRFAQPMVGKQQIRVKIANTRNQTRLPVRIQPYVPGEFYWIKNDELLFRPKPFWSELTQYTVSVNPGYKLDSRYQWEKPETLPKGKTHEPGWQPRRRPNRLTFKTLENTISVQYFFTPENRMALEDFYPASGKYRVDVAKAKSVRPEKRLWIRFSRNLGKYARDKKKLDALLKVSPPLALEYKWLDDRLLEIVPKGNWRQATRYRISLLPALFYAREQHFAPGAARLEFVTGKNIVQISGVDAASPYPAKTGFRHEPMNKLVLKFSKNMKPRQPIGEKIDLAKIDPEALPVRITPAVQGRLYWKNSRELVIVPRPYFLATTLYKVELNESLLPQAEARYAHGKVFYLKTERNVVSLSRFSPSDEVGTAENIVLEFDKPVKPKAARIGSEVKTRLVRIYPSIEGHWSWVSDRILQFEPAEKLQPSSRYIVSVDPNEIENKQYSWYTGRDKVTKRYPLSKYRFNTPGIRVLSAEHSTKYDKADLLKQRFVIHLTLSDAVRLDEFKKYFSIWYKQPNLQGEEVRRAIAYRVRPAADSQGRRFVIESRWIRRVQGKDRTVYYGIGKGLMPLAGNLGFEADYVAEFTQKAVTNIRITAVQWKHRFGQTTALVNLNAPVRIQELKKHLTVHRVHYQWRPGVALDYQVQVNNRSSKGYVYRVRLKQGFKPGRRYKFVVSKGLLALNGNITLEEAEAISDASDYEKTLRFGAKGSFLSRKDMRYLPVQITNQKRIRVVVEKVYASNLSYYLNNYYKRDDDLETVARVVYDKVLRIADLVKEEETYNKHYKVTVDLKKLFAQNVHGVYRVTLYRMPDRARKDEVVDEVSEQTDRRWFLATDIGLNVRSFSRRLLVWSTSLKTGTVLKNTQVQVFDTLNQVIGSGRTDDQGIASIRLSGQGMPKHVIAKIGDDMSFVNLRVHKTPMHGFDIEGIKTESQVLKAYVYSSRGVYRPGETVNLVAVIRDQADNMPGRYPARLVITSPDGVEAVDDAFTVTPKGVYSYDFHTDAGARSGKWHARVVWKGRTIGRYSFQVEEFIPNKISVRIKSPKAISAGDRTLKFSVLGEHKFGGAAAGLKVSAEVTLVANRFKPKDHARYVFGNDEHKLAPRKVQLGEGKLDGRGSKEYLYRLPDSLRVSRGVTLQLAATVLDDAGRGVSHYFDTQVYLFASYVGLRRTSSGRYQRGKKIRFHLVNVDKDGKPVRPEERRISLRVYRMKPLAYFRKNPRGYYRYVTEKVKTLYQELDGSLKSDGRFAFVPRHGGEYIVEAKDLNSGQLTQFRFSIWGQTLQDRLTPNRITMKAVEQRTRVGEPLKLQMKIPFKGSLLVTVEREKVFFHRVLHVERGVTEISLPSNPDYYPNIYVSVVLIRPARQPEASDPVIASGLLNIPVYDTARHPRLELDVADKIEPDKEVTAKIRLTGRYTGPVHFTLSAVDTGILDLTNFKLPSIANYFRTKIRLETLHYTMYHLLMPFVAETKRLISPSGDEGSKQANKKRRVNPDSIVRVKPVALWSGVLKLNARGEARVTFKVPSFNGELRFHAVAFGHKRYTMAQKNVLVYDKLIVRPGVPRFFAVGDEVDIPVTVFNKTGTDDKVQIELQTSDNVKLQGRPKTSVMIRHDAKGRVRFRIRILQSTGIARIKVIARSKKNSRVKQISVPIRYPANRVETGGKGRIDASTPLTLTMPTRFIDRSVSYRLSISSSPLAEYANSIRYLVRYPHGCLEQTTSKLFPMLYFKDLALSAGIVDMRAAKLKAFMRAGIDKIESMQSNGGLFFYWSESRHYVDWASIYAAHFLVEARDAGYRVSKKTWNGMLAWLKKSLAQAETRYGLENKIYRLYVLALARQNVVAQLNYIYDNQFDQLQPHERARLASAYFLNGEKRVAEDILDGLDRLDRYDRRYRDTGGNFSSNTRDLAAVLEAYALIKPKAARVRSLVAQLVGFSDQGNWGTTQENAFALLALAKVYRKGAGDVDAQVILGDGTRLPFKQSLRLGDHAYRTGKLRIEIHGPGKLSFAWKASGVDKRRKALREDKGLVVRKRYLDKQGKPLDPKKIRQGDLVVVEVSLQARRGRVDNVAIVDLLPAGLEIENSRLSTAVKLDWANPSLLVQSKDIRDDRMVVFATASPRPGKFYYLTRAVTAGRFAVPEIRAEAMYDPSLFSWSGAGVMRISPDTLAGRSGR